MEQQKIDRINQLARKQRQQGLSPEEQQEQQLLRREYIDAMKHSLRTTLENTVIQDPQGNRRRAAPKPNGKN